MSGRSSIRPMGSLTRPELTVLTGGLHTKRHLNKSDTTNEDNYGQTIKVVPTLTKSSQNTHKTQPEVTFRTRDVERITEAVLIESLQEMPYDANRCKDMSQELAAKIMDRLKSLHMKHYKLVAVVSIGSINERPGMQFGSRCLWNSNTDCFASVKFTNGSLFAVAMIFGLHFE